MQQFFLIHCPLLSAVYSFSLLQDNSMATVSALPCCPVAKRATHLHIPQGGVGEILSLVTENASSLHCLHSCAWLLLACRLFIQLQERPLTAYWGDTRPGPLPLCLLITQTPKCNTCSKRPETETDSIGPFLELFKKLSLDED